MKSPFLSIIITNYNAMKWLDACLTSIKVQGITDYEVIFVDDGSTDGSFGYIQKKYPWCVFIRNKMNVGFAKSNNIGVQAAKGDFLFFLNADTFLHKNVLTKLKESLIKNPNISIAQLDIRNYDKSKMGGNVCTFTIDAFGYPMWSGAPDKIFYADAAAMIIRRDLFRKLLGFDERFYIYLEDLDLSWKARLYGETIYFLAKIYVYHYGGGTSISTQAKKRTYTSTIQRRFDAQKNNICILIKNLEISSLAWRLPGSLLLASCEGFLYLLKGNVSGFFALHNAIVWNILNIRKTLKIRNKIQKIRAVSDSIVFQNTDKRISKITSFFLYGIPLLKNEKNT